MALPLESVHRLTFVSDGRDLSTQVRVRHVEQDMSADGERTYLIGVEFISATPALQEQIERWLLAGEGAAAAEA